MDERIKSLVLYAYYSGIENPDDVYDYVCAQTGETEKETEVTAWTLHLINEGLLEMTLDGPRAPKLGVGSKPLP